MSRYLLLLLAVTGVVATAAWAEPNDRPATLFDHSWYQYTRHAHVQIDFVLGRELTVRSIRYNDIDAGEMRFGDPPGGLYWYRQGFADERLAWVENMMTQTRTGRDELWRRTDYEYSGTRVTVRHSDWDGVLEYEIVPDKERDVLAHRSLNDGSAVIARGSNEIRAYGSTARYEEDRPSQIFRWTGESPLTGRAELHGYAPFDRLISLDVYEDGIKVESLSVLQGYREVYTTIDGTGTLDRFDLDGALLWQAELERRRDHHGLLIYERIRYPDGRGSVYEASMEYE